MAHEHRWLDFAYLKQAVSIERVLAHRGLLQSLQPRGSRLIGACPIHNGNNTGAFVIDRHKGLWHCFSACGRGGDVVELVRSLEHCSYREAALYLAQVEGSPLRVPLLPAPPPTSPFRPFTRRLPLDPHHPLLRHKGISPRTAQHFEVGAWRGGGMLTGCVAFRLRDPRGRPWGYAGRRLHADEVQRRGKWVFPARLPKSELLYGFAQARSQLHRGLVVVEGAWDVLRLHQLGVPSVALLGAELSQAQKALLQRAPKIVLMLDADDTGRRATQHILSQLTPSVPTHRVTLPLGSDPDELSDSHLLKLLQPSLPF